jgi:hypothetical protein
MSKWLQGCSGGSPYFHGCARGKTNESACVCISASACVFEPALGKKIHWCSCPHIKELPRTMNCARNKMPRQTRVLLCVAKNLVYTRCTFAKARAIVFCLFAEMVKHPSNLPLMGNTLTFRTTYSASKRRFERPLACAAVHMLSVNVYCVPALFKRLREVILRRGSHSHLIRAYLC